MSLLDDSTLRNPKTKNSSCFSDFSRSMPKHETPSQVQEVLMSKAEADVENPQATDEQLLQVLDRLHRNLGHPPSHDLIRVLKQASERALGLARKYECQLCKTHIRPHVALPAKTSRVSEFNHTIGLMMEDQSKDQSTEHCLPWQLLPIGHSFSRNVGCLLKIGFVFLDHLVLS